MGGEEGGEGDDDDDVDEAAAAAALPSGFPSFLPYSVAWILHFRQRPAVLLSVKKDVQKYLSHPNVPALLFAAYDSESDFGRNWCPINYELTWLMFSVKSGQNLTHPYKLSVDSEMELCVDSEKTVSK